MKKLILLSFTFLTLAACSSDDNSKIDPVVPAPSSGTVFGSTENPLNVGGANQGNQVYIDLSGETALEISRDSWDLGFYSGTTPHVVINGALGMAVKKLETTDITQVQVSDATVAIGTFNAENMAYVDNPTGDINSTAFGEIASNEASASVYLVNLGNSVPTQKPDAGSANVSGTPRGWKKVKVWQDGNGYKLQFAAIDATTATTVSIAKDAAYNHTFFNLTTGVTVNVEPQKDKWDLNFTTFTNEVFDGTGGSAGAYFYADFVVTNSKAGVTAFKVEGDANAYAAFTLSDVTSGNYTYSTDQRAIGADWRDVFTHAVYNNVFFVVKDGESNIYKVKFISMVSTEGERGFPVFQYELLK
ncbi:HmuY family protein [Flavobacterium sp. NRK1]|uniref:HmuY family protein n=1 Tax=Flavobacterium sp. NRK1 TaxID=2954929 RepID=UPI0020921D30|nr:HmuY family protein [Flavobacterium sp. NRK1]MCO6147601.1 hypothetical protein [Flavobacterium sp. NRK1]